MSKAQAEAHYRQSLTEYEKSLFDSGELTPAISTIIAIMFPQIVKIWQQTSDLLLSTYIWREHYSLIRSLTS